jgi:hypothetical protein
MKHFSTFLFILCVPIFFTNKQPVSNDLIIKEVFELAKTGYDNLDPISLIKAAKLLIENPQIQQIEAQNVSNNYEPSKAENILEEHNFFNPKQLLDDADKLVPFDDKILKFRIKLLKKRIPDYYAEMGEADADIQVKNYLVYGNNSKKIQLNIEEGKRITLSVRIGNDLGLTVLDTKKKTVGKSQFIGDARLLKFTSNSTGKYEITIENKADEANDCYLMIETK